MEFVLDPPVGVGDLKLGASRNEICVVLGRLGTPRPFGRGEGPLGWVVERPATVFTYCDAEGLTDAIEFASPRRLGGDSVHFGGIDLFMEPAIEVMASLTHAGISIREEENGYSFTAHDLVLSLWRDGEPTGEDGLPTYFASALIARLGYYD